MRYRFLGQTGIKVSKLAFGTLTISPLQKNLTPKESLPLLLNAFNKGINFYDTAEGYDNYSNLKLFLEHVDRKNVVISTKTYAYTRSQAKESLEKALNEMNTEYIDIFMLHEQISEHTLRGHQEALDYLCEMKEAGVIKALGISTHYVSGVLGSLLYDEIDIIHPIINKNGIGICDGDVNQMEEAIKKASKHKGIFAMKALAGGHLLNDIDAAFEYILNLDTLDSIAIGMQNLNELNYNVNKFEKKPIHDTIIQALDFQNRKLHIGDWCTRCGSCIEFCQQKALSIKDNQLKVDHERCTCCGYCSRGCNEFCIKII